MAITLYNTATRSKQEFVPQDGKTAKIYCCGPTVYHYAHIGNLRTYIFEDLLRRSLAYHGFDAKHVVNITDVGHLTSDADEGEDKMEKGAKRTGKSVWEVAAFYTDAFMRDFHSLNLLEPTVWCRATDHIAEQIALVKTLEEKGYTYRTSDGIYYDSSKFERYGDFARLDLENLWAGSRISMGEKRLPTDFALWKFSPKDVKRQMEWDSPWGVGFPGWHIECSAMAMKHLGETLDIHCGGTDHIRVHHTNEIAQSEAATGKTFSRFWMHGEFLRLDGDKMSKSTGEFLTVDSLVKRGFSPMDYRYFALGSHYRNYLSFSFESLESARKSRLALRKRTTPLVAKALAAGAKIESEAALKWKERFAQAVGDDLNVPAALGLLHSAVRDDAVSEEERGALVLDFDRVLGLKLDREEEAAPAAAEDSEAAEIDALVAERAAAKKAKDFARADEIRNDLAKRGIELKDGPQGTTWERKR